MKPTVTLRRQLLRWLLTLLLSLWVIASVATYIVAVRFANVGYDRGLKDTLLSLAAEVEFKDGHVVLDLPPAAQKILEFDQYDHVYYKVYQKEPALPGRLLLGRQDVPSPPTSPTEGDQPVFTDGAIDGNKIRIASLYIPYEGGYILVQVAETLSKRTITANQILSTIVLPQGLLIVLAAIAVWFGVTRGLAPLSRLQQAVASRSPRDLSPMSEEGAPEEVRLLVRSINKLLERLSRVLTTQRRFIADAAHALRTPLAGLKTQIELALQESDRANTRQILSQLHLGIEHSARLAHQLLSLAKAEHYAERPIASKAVDLGALARSVTSDSVPAALARKIDLGFDCATSPMFVLGDEVLLKEMLVNLLDNAIRYSREGGVATTRVVGDAEFVELIVEDNGPGIPLEERMRVFEPFYRVPGVGAEGCGLGLAIVREIAFMHAADCALETGPQQRGTIVRVRFRRVAATRAAATGDAVDIVRQRAAGAEDRRSTVP